MTDKILHYSTINQNDEISHTINLKKGADTLVILNQEIAPLDSLASAQTHGRHYIVDIPRLLGVKPRRIKKHLHKIEGDRVEENEVLASIKQLFRKERTVASPITGVILESNEGVMFIQGDRTYKDIVSPIPGQIHHIEPDEYIIMKIIGARVELVWGNGGNAWATVKILGKHSDDVITPEKITIEHRGEIIVLCSQLSAELLVKATEVGVKGIIAPSMNYSLLEEIKNSDFPVGLTNGFGDFQMASEIYLLLKQFEGKEVALDTNPGQDWRGTRPQIIIPDRDSVNDESSGTYRPLYFALDQEVRLTQSPVYGMVGKIVGFSYQENQFESGYWRNSVKVRVKGSEILAPIENLEHIS